MISHAHRCIFIHIPKTAGTSIEKKLGHFTAVSRDVQDHRTLQELEPFAWRDISYLARGRGRHVLKHIRNNFQGQPAPTRAQYRDYYKFTFVRNTWARIFSWYRNVLSDQVHRQARGITGDMDLHEFLIRFPDDWGTRSQLFWINDSRGNISLDYVGRFETLAADFVHVGRAIGLKDPNLPKLLVGEGIKYTDFYNQETIDLVYKRYNDEIRCLGFEYGE